VRQAALAVVGEHYHVAVGERGLELGELRGERLARRRLLEVDAQQLLLAADDAQLLRGVDLAVAVQARLDAFLHQQRGELVAWLVAPDDRQQARARLQLGAIPGHVRRAAEPVILALDEHHRNRRLGRDARDVAEPVAVEHHVAHHQHARLGCVGSFYVLRPMG
jgi:hypothetical protein